MCRKYEDHEHSPESDTIEFNLLAKIVAQYQKHPNCPKLMEGFGPDPTMLESMIPIAVFVGAFHGFIVGGIAGPFCNGDGFLGQASGAQLAAWGCFIGAITMPIWYGFIAVLLSFKMIKRDPSEPMLVTIKRRLAMLFSPVMALAHVVRNQV